MERNQNLTVNDKKFFEKLSKRKLYRTVLKDLQAAGFTKIGKGASAVVFTKKSVDYVIKVGDKIDKQPPFDSYLRAYYAKMLYTSKNRKIKVQEKARTDDKSSRKALKLLSNLLYSSERELFEEYDIRMCNCGMIKETPVVFDYRNYEFTGDDRFALAPTWNKRPIY